MLGEWQDPEVNSSTRNGRNFQIHSGVNNSMHRVTRAGVQASIISLNCCSFKWVERELIEVRENTRMIKRRM